MRQYRDQAAMREAIAQHYLEHGARVVDRDGKQFALFFNSIGQPVAAFDIGQLAAAIERKLS